jgi:dTDP-4-dehydrorhamnose reductase
MKIFITGSGGMLARAVINYFENNGNDQVLECADISELDITDLNAVTERLGASSPDVIINLAAFTNVDGAESEAAEAMRVNATGACNLAKAAKAVSARLIHISTDFVFDGKKNTPYLETDETNAMGSYGASKYAGEIEIDTWMDDYIIIRTSWLYGAGGKNFVDTILAKARTEKKLKVVFDQVGTPTYTNSLAEAIFNLLDAPAGIYNFSNEGVASWYDLAIRTVELARMKGMELKVKSIEPVLSAEFPTPAKRPSYSVLDKGKYKSVTGKSVKHWSEALEGYIDTFV